MPRQNIELQNELEPKRMEYAISKLHSLGYVSLTHDDTKIEFFHRGEKCTLFVYSGWHTGKSIKDGRGIHNLLKQLETK